MKALEEERIKRVIGSPLEAQVSLIIADDSLRTLCEAHHETLAEAFVVSSVQVVPDGATRGGAAREGVPGGVEVRVERAPGEKCQRCWKYLASVGSQPAHPQLCERCVEVVSA